MLVPGTPGGGNVITGNMTGIWSRGGNNIIRGNLIGPNADGSPSFGNENAIVTSLGTDVIGGMNAADGNVIAYNSFGIDVGGIEYTGGTAKILSNLFYGNLNTEIHLGDGAAINDFLDQDQGPNSLQNFPIILSVARNPGETVVSGGLNSTPSTIFTLQFFAQISDSNPSERLLGMQTVTTNSAGDAPFQVMFPVTTLPEEFITATATDPDGNTSEFFPRNGRVDLANISTRGNITPGESILIGGFILKAGSARRLFIRALGPSLSVNGALADPRIELRSSSGEFIAGNNNWRDTQESEIAATGLAPTNEQEAALIVYNLDTFPDENYTVLVNGTDGGSGVATVEIYALDSDDNGLAQQFLNISTRGQVGTGDNALIGGTILQGGAGQKLIVRAIGPDLANAGVNDSLQNPILELRDSDGNILASNDDWRSDQEQEIIATGLAPQDDRDSVILTSLYPTSYTAIVRGKNDTTGVALVEIYKLE